MKAIVRDCMILILVVLLHMPSAVSQERVTINSAKPDSPKTVTFKFTRTPDSFFKNLKRLEGSMIELQQDSARLVSTPIKVQETEGTCTIGDVRPGSYELKVVSLWQGCPALSLATVINIPERSISAVAFEINIGSAVTIKRADNPKQ